MIKPEDIRIEIIGYIESKFKEKADPFVMREEESTVVIYDEYADGLYRIKEKDFIQVIFAFHRSNQAVLKGPTYDGTVKGVFASRSPYRPSSLGLTTVRLLSVDRLRLQVKGLDAIDGTPVLDIKPFARPMDMPEEG